MAMANFFQNIFTKNDKLDIDQLIVKKTVISFFFFFVFMSAGFAGWKWLRHQPADANGTRGVLRAAFQANEVIFKGFLSDKHLAKEYPLAEAEKKIRFNGPEGLRTPLDSAKWRLYVIRSNGDTL